MTENDNYFYQSRMFNLMSMLFRYDQIYWSMSSLVDMTTNHFQGIKKLQTIWRRSGKLGFWVRELTAPLGYGNVLGLWTDDVSLATLNTVAMVSHIVIDIREMSLK